MAGGLLLYQIGNIKPYLTQGARCRFCLYVLEKFLLKCGRARLFLESSVKMLFVVCCVCLALLLDNSENLFFVHGGASFELVNGGDVPAQGPGVASYYLPHHKAGALSRAGPWAGTFYP